MQSHSLLRLARSCWILILSFYATSCAADAFHASTTFTVREAQAAFIQELTTADIPFRVDADGQVWYRLEDQKEVSEIQAKIINTVLVGPRAVSYSREEDTQLFIDALRKENIPYGIKMENGKKFVTWSAENNAQVKAIEREILKKIRERRDEKRAADQKLNGSN
jgi:hypothetical protein